MQILEHPQPITSSATSLIQDQVTIRAKLAMIWVSQTDGSRQRLVAKWVRQD
ncbi:MAG: hypothetical protein KME05_23230 [Gloeocapsa sp. UFS-A4-WI-NPMV-4B04]|jgi:hypothetical protein|nr:hypothetical protein [Gloeocapsa sp. UFS-A4-WI-NPMV-4B04]